MTDLEKFEVLRKIDHGETIPGSSMTVMPVGNGKYNVISIDNPLFNLNEDIKKKPFIYNGLDEEGVKFFQKTLHIETVVRTAAAPALDNVIKNQVNRKIKNVFN